MTTTGITPLYAVIGNPVAHSLSPYIMNRAFGLFGVNAVYLAFEVEPALLSSAVAGLSALGAGGLNVTYPFKDPVVEFVDELSPDAEHIQAVNTMIFRKNKIFGYNTDAPGTAAALETFAGMSTDGKRVFVFGAGGAARAAAYGVLQKGARSVTFGVRREEKAAEVERRFRGVFSGRIIDHVLLQNKGGERPQRNARSAIEQADIVINATPVGMGFGDEAPLIEDSRWINDGQCFFDLVYNKENTEFLETARARGAKTLDGLALLVSQAAESFKLWTGESFDVKDMAHAVASRARKGPTIDGRID